MEEVRRMGRAFSSSQDLANLYGGVIKVKLGKDLDLGSGATSAGTKA